MSQTIQVSAERVRQLLTKLERLAWRQGFMEALFERAEDAGIDQGEIPRLLREQMDNEAMGVLSELNRALWGDINPPANPIKVVAQAVASLGGRRVRWPDARDWLRAMWGWTGQQAEYMLFLGCFEILPLDDPEIAKGLPVPYRDRPVSVRGTREFGTPDRDWTLNLRPSKVEVTDLKRRIV